MFQCTFSNFCFKLKHLKQTLDKAAISFFCLPIDYFGLDTSGHHLVPVLIISQNTKPQSHIIFVSACIARQVTSLATANQPPLVMRRCPAPWWWCCSTAASTWACPCWASCSPSASTTPASTAAATHAGKGEYWIQILSSLSFRIFQAFLLLCDNLS